MAVPTESKGSNMTEKAPGDDQPEGERIPLDAAEPEPGTLTLTTTADGTTLTLTGGTAIPAAITVVDESGTPLARYVAGDLSPATRSSNDHGLWYIPISMASSRDPDFGEHSPKEWIETEIELK